MSALIGSFAAALFEHAAFEKINHLLEHRVIERWSKHRARQFQAAFLDALTKQFESRQQSATLDEMMVKIGDDDAATEMLFESYRRVCLSASKTIGPRLIGLLTAIILVEGRAATDVEELIFQAAEMLSDADFLELIAWARKSDRDFSCELHAYARKRYDRTEYLGQHAEDADWATNSSIARSVGIWAQKLASLGLVWQTQSRKEHHRILEDVPRTSPTIEHRVQISKTCIAIAELAERARLPG